MQPTTEEIKLAPQVVEAIEKLSEKECPDCKGRGGRVDDYPGVHCPACNGTGKVGWEWEPQVGEWCIDKFTNRPVLIYVMNNKDIYLACKNATQYNTYTNTKDKLILILPWERIKGILEKNNYKTYISISDSGNVLCQICFPFKRRGRHNVMVQANAKTRQLAVMKAVIALGKEINNG